MAEAVIQRAGDDLAPIGAHVGRQVGVGDARLAGDDDLGPARAPTGGRRFPRRRDLVGQVVIGKRWVGLEADGHGGASGMGAVVHAHHQRRRSQLHDGVALTLRQPGRHRLRDRSQLPHRHARLVELDAVGEGDGHHVALAHTHGLVGARQPVGALVELLARDRSPFVRDRRAVRVGQGEVGDLPPDRYRCHGVGPQASSRNAMTPLTKAGSPTAERWSPFTTAARA